MNKFRGKNQDKQKEKPEYEQKLLSIDRVTRVVAGGRRFSFRATVALGDRKGKIGVGVAKGQDVSMAVEKAVSRAKKQMIKIATVSETIPFEVKAKFGSARVLLRPAPVGKGIVAGGPVRIICDLAGIKNVSAKILSKSKNKLNIARATIKALQQFK